MTTWNDNILLADIPPLLLELQKRLLRLREEGRLILQNGDEGYATAPSNIALLKYWGKQAGRKQIPQNSSLSFTLGGFRTFTKIEVQGRFFPEMRAQKLLPHRISFDSKEEHKGAEPKLARFLDSLLAGWGEEISFCISTFNNFPTACGIASSASGYAALVGALADLLQLTTHFSEQELDYWMAHWARIGSGSAARSVFRTSHPHCVAWEVDDKASQEFSAVTNIPFHEGFNNLGHLVLVVDANPKQVSSSEGHKFALTSPLQSVRLASVPRKFRELKKALCENDFAVVRDISESDAFQMHAVMQTATPPARYLEEVTASLISAFVSLRDESDADAFWTLDAGPNVHLLFRNEPPERAVIESFIQKATQILGKQGREAKILMNNFSAGLALGKKEWELFASHTLLLNHWPS